MSVFISKDAEILVTLFTYRTSEGKLLAWAKSQTIPEGVDQSKVETNIIKFRVPNYGDNLKVMDSSIRYEDGKMSMAPSQIPFIRFVQLLKSWDFRDEKGEIVPANSESILLLENSVAQAIATELDRQILET